MPAAAARAFSARGVPLCRGRTCSGKRQLLTLRQISSDIRVKMTRVQANLLLLLAAAIWGGGFVAQSTAMHSIGPFWFIGLRFVVATAAVLPFVVLESRKAKV